MQTVETRLSMTGTVQGKFFAEEHGLLSFDPLLCHHYRVGSIWKQLPVIVMATLPYASPPPLPKLTR